MANKKVEERLAKLARQIAKTGKHISWHHVAGEVYNKGEPLAFEVLGMEPIRSEIDAVCQKLRKR